MSRAIFWRARKASNEQTSENIPPTTWLNIYSNKFIIIIIIIIIVIQLCRKWIW